MSRLPLSLLYVDICFFFYMLIYALSVIYWYALSFYSDYILLAFLLVCLCVCMNASLCVEKAMAPHSSTLAWKVPWTEKPGGLQSMGSLSWTWLSDFTFTFHFHALEKEMATHSSVLAWRIPGTGEPGGLPSKGSHRVGHNWRALAAAAAAFVYGGTTEDEVNIPNPGNEHSSFAVTLLRWGFESVELILSWF